MKNKIVVNARCFSRLFTGVERCAHEISKRIQPSRIIQPNHPHDPITGNLWEQFVLPAQIQRNEILWSPANAGPWQVQNQVVTLHDASVFDHPGWFKPSFAAWTRLSWKILAKRVKAVITVSSFSRDRLKIHLRIPAEKIHVIYNGVGKPFEPQPQTAIDQVKRKYKINKPYILFVGTREPRKNLSTLAEAWKGLNSNTHMLFVAGAKGKVFASAINDIKNSGYIQEQDLPALYAGATVFVMPSFYEGFGLTALEAMACGTPVIASNRTAFPEILGEAALLVDPSNLAELSNALQKIIKDKRLANQLHERGLAHAAKFSWDETAQKTQSLLENIQ